MTTNEMILKTISTKTTKEPKYKSILENMGYVICISDWGECGCWCVENPVTDRLVVFSKGYDKKKRLYGGYKPIKEKDYKKIDFVGYLKCTRTYGDKKTNKYNELRNEIKLTKEYIKDYKKDMEKAQKKIEEAIKNFEYLQSRYDENVSKLEECRKKVKELKK